MGEIDFGVKGIGYLCMFCERFTVIRRNRMYPMRDGKEQFGGGGTDKFGTFMRDL